jgi:cyclopropane-fatty-acyl-phospholipid synthase
MCSFYRSTVNELFRLADVVPGQDITVHDENFYGEFLADPSLALGEAYMESRITIPDVMGTTRKLSRLSHERNRWRIIKALGWRTIFLFGLLLRMAWRYLLCRCCKIIPSKAVIDLHYNLPIELYTAMLGPTMQYSCAYYDRPDIGLDDAQKSKIDLIIGKLQLFDGASVLDIGCGYGYLAYSIAKQFPNCRVVGINISRMQLIHACDNYKLRNLTFMHCSFTQIPEYLIFDRIVSVGMFEHVGLARYQSFMTIIDAHLNPKGIVLLHTIANKEVRYTTDRWLGRYIFPEGRLPSLAEIELASLKTSLIIEDVQDFGLDYAQTLIHWRQNFKAAWNNKEVLLPELLQFGFLSDKKKNDDDSVSKCAYSNFYRLWMYYLYICEGSFLERNTTLKQVVFSKELGKTYRRCCEKS